MMTSAAFLLGIIGVQLVLRIYLNCAEEYIRSKTGMDLRNYMTVLLLKKDYAAVKEKHSGEWLNRMFSDISIISDGIATIFPNLTNMVTRLVCAIAVLFFLQPVFAYIFIVGGSILILCTGIFRGKLKKLHCEVQEKQGKVQSFLQELIENYLIVKIFSEESSMEKRAQCLQQEHFNALMHRRKVSILANAGFSSIFQVGYFFALCWGAGGLLYGTISYGTLTAILQLVGQIQAPVSNLSGVLPKIYGVLASTERIMELERYPNEEAVSEATGEFMEICARQVDFSYGSIAVLEQVSFSVQRGDMIALTGLSGGGKSTIFLLLLGIYTSNHGKILIKTTEKSLLPGRDSRTLFTYVPQGNGLFSGTIRDNIQFGMYKASDQEIWRALDIACAKEFVAGLPDELDTVVGEKGLGLSEGQIQRIAIARAVLRTTPIILLDEATSALDARTEAAVLKNIAELQHKTCLIVTHREAALKVCNKQLCLQDGKITEKLLLHSEGKENPNGREDI